ncbi:MAG: hypothetical protein FD180_1137 [Planctomycetota bacterium]|nr:MAG: hypothetical protein FD180_1137 [Planctomycetota bacterium]
MREAAWFGKVLKLCVDGNASLDDLGPRLAAVQRAVGKAEADHRLLKPPPGSRARDLMEASRALLAIEHRFWFEEVPKLVLALQMADAATRQKLLADAVESLSRAEAESLRLREAVKAAQKAFAEECGFALVAETTHSLTSPAASPCTSRRASCAGSRANARRRRSTCV